MENGYVTFSSFTMAAELAEVVDDDVKTPFMRNKHPIIPKIPGRTTFMLFINFSLIDWHFILSCFPGFGKNKNGNLLNSLPHLAAFFSHTEPKNSIHASPPWQILDLH
jgi:hypothetical protein